MGKDIDETGTLTLEQFLACKRDRHKERQVAKPARFSDWQHPTSGFKPVPRERVEAQLDYAVLEMRAVVAGALAAGAIIIQDEIIYPDTPEGRVAFELACKLLGGDREDGT